MGKSDIFSTNSPIVLMAKKHRYELKDLCRALNVTEPTMISWIRRPHDMRLNHVLTLCGLFGCDPIEFLWLLLHNKPSFRGKQEVRGELKEIKEKMENWLKGL